jgi:hypothetical protein
MKKLSVVLAILGMFGGVPAVNGDQGFDTKTIEGTFAFSAHGVVGTNTAIPFPPFTIVAGTPVVTVGVITFNEDGTCVSTATTKVGGFSAIPPNPSAACTFSVNPEGTGTIRVTNVGSPFSPVELAFAIVDRREFLVITTDELVLSGVAKRQ